MNAEVEVAGAHNGTAPAGAKGRTGDGAAAPPRRAGLRVMHVITGLHTGGAERMLSRIVLSQRARTPPPCVVSLVSGGPTFAQLVAAGVPVADLAMQRGRPSPAAIWRLAVLIRREKPHVIQSWMYHADLVSAVALLLSGRRRKTRLFWGVRCSNMDVRRYGAGLDIVIDVCSWMSGVPDAVIANSHEGKSFHERLGFRSRRFIVIDNGTDTDLYRPDAAARQRVRAELGIVPDRPLLVTVARLDPMKDYDCFLAALDRLPGVAALAIGDGTDDLPSRPGLFRLGERGDVPSLLAAGDILVSSSAFGEGFSNAVAEGMAAGLPAVVTDVGDSARIVGETGLVVPPRDPEALAAAIAALLEEPPDRRAERRARARQRIVENFSLRRAVEAFDAVHYADA